MSGLYVQDFPLRMSGFPRGVVEYAAFLDAEPADAAEVAELADWLFGRGQFPKLDGVDMELLGCEVRFPTRQFSCSSSSWLCSGKKCKPERDLELL